MKAEQSSTNLTIQVFVSLPDSGRPDVVFEAAAESLVADATQAAADEWGTDAEFLELEFSGSVIPKNSLLVSHGIESGSQLTASLVRVFGREWLANCNKREKLMQHLSKMGEQHLSLDTPSFATDGRFWFDMHWIQHPVVEISFVNPHPSITSAEFKEPNEYDGEEEEEDESEDEGDEVFLVSKIDLTGLGSITTIGSNFLSSCSLLTALDLTSLCNVTEVGNSVLNDCSSLTSLDLASLCNITKIGDCFVAGCRSLTSLNLGSPNNITEIGDFFLAGCTSLTSLNLTSLNNIQKIGEWFLGECSSLRSLDLTGLINITEIGDRFLGECSLTRVDLGSLSPESIVRSRVEELDL